MGAKWLLVQLTEAYRILHTCKPSVFLGGQKTRAINKPSSQVDLPQFLWVHSAANRRRIWLSLCSSQHSKTDGFLAPKYMHRCTHTYKLLLLLLQLQWKSAQKDANTACPPQSPHRRTESAMAVVRQSQNFPPATDPLPGRAGPPKFNHRPSLVKIDACNFELSS